MYMYMPAILSSKPANAYVPLHDVTSHVHRKFVKAAIYVDAGCRWVKMVNKFETPSNLVVVVRSTLLAYA